MTPNCPKCDADLTCPEIMRLAGQLPHNRPGRPAQQRERPICHATYTGRLWQHKAKAHQKRSKA